MGETLIPTGEPTSVGGTPMDFRRPTRIGERIGQPHLDVLRAVADVPVASYQVSGEYAMAEFAAQAGALDRERVALESLLPLRRGGAQIVLTYWALEAAQHWLD